MHVLAERGMNTPDLGLVNTAGSCLSHHRAPGLIRSAKGLRGRLVWQVE